MAALSLDCLPFDCIVTLCEYLSADDLVRFGLVCTVSICTKFIVINNEILSHSCSGKPHKLDIYGGKQSYATVPLLLMFHYVICMVCIYIQTTESVSMGIL